MQAIGGEMVINKIPELKRLELNKENVTKVLFDCKVNENSKNNIPDNFLRCSIISQRTENEFWRRTISQNIKIIQYLLGQLYGVHKQKDPLTPGEGIINYKGQNGRMIIGHYLRFII